MALVGKNSEKNNQNLMQLIRRAHGLVENPDLEKHRQSQDHIGELLGNSKELQYRPVDIDGMDAEWVSVNRAHMKKYVILHCHGGGYSTGSSIYARTLTSKLAAGTSMDVLCFDYRLAPEHPYPAAAEDAMKAWNYLMLLGYGARDVIITGDSAGGNLALSLVLKLKEQERLFPRGIVLMSPWTDLTNSGKSYQTNFNRDPQFGGTTDNMLFHSTYIGDADPENPYISPLFGSFEQFPPILFQVGSEEVLLDDTLRVAEKVRKTHGKLRVTVYEGMFHVFQMSMDLIPESREAWDEVARFMQIVFRIDRRPEGRVVRKVKRGR